ncbi:MAG: hypothetical protein R2822_05180 [Spirosomataceae bacterium]
MTPVEWLILVILFIGVATGIAQYDWLPRYAKFLLYFFIVTFLLEVNADYYMTAFRSNNLFLYHIFIPFQYITLALFLRENLHNSLVKQSINYSIFLVIVSAIVFSGFVQSLKEMPFYILLLTRILLIVWALMYFQQLMKAKKVEVLSQIPAFWVSSGILIYFVSFFQMGLMRYLIIEHHQLANFWIYIVLWFDVVFYLFCLFPILKYRNHNWPRVDE